MFDTEDLADLTAAQLLDAAAANRNARLRAEDELLLIAAAWADDQDRASDPSASGARTAQRSDPDGGAGLPQLDEDAVCEFGAVLGLGFVSARNLIGDAVRIRHRMPRMWERVQSGTVAAWQVRKISQAASDLDWDSAADVDAQLAGLVGMLPWPRLLKLVTAAVLTADPAAAQARAERARTERFVRSFVSDDGLKTIVARASSGDAVWFMAAINRIADILASQGETDPIDVLRSRAVGILAHPAEALRILAAGSRTKIGAPSAEAAADEIAETERATKVEHALETEQGVEHAPPVPDPDAVAEANHVSMPHELTATASAGIDLNARGLRPRAVLYFHLTDASLEASFDAAGVPQLGGLVRPEHGEPLVLSELHRFLSDTGCQVTVRPVVTVADQAPVDCYEIPSRIREAVRLRNLVDVFPYGSCDLRGMDLDHTLRYDPGGPPGQTRPDNLGPLSRTSHRACTPRIGPGGRFTGRWQKRQPSPGTHVWRSPHGWIHLTTNQGTLTLGPGGFAQHVWAQAGPQFVRAA